MYYTYIVRTDSGSLYTGITSDLFRRMKEHNEQGKRGAKYTRSQKIHSLAALWSSPNRSTSSRLESAIKALKKKDKELLVAKPEQFSALFPKLEKEDFVYHPKANLDFYLKKIPLSRLP